MAQVNHLAAQQVRRDPFAHGDDDAGCLRAGHERQLDRVGRSGAVVEVDEVETDEGIAHQRLPRPRAGHRPVDDVEHLGPAVPADLDGLHPPDNLARGARVGFGTAGVGGGFIATASGGA